MNKSKATDEDGGEKKSVDKKAEAHFEGQTPQGGQRLELGSILGVVTALMMDSPMHQHLFIADMKWLVVPPIQLQQFRIYRREGKPFAYVSWGMLSEEVGNRMKNGLNRLRPDEWNSGDQAWLIDLIAPFGGQGNVLKDLKQNHFSKQKLRVFRPTRDGSGMTVVEL
jgi:cytolysin-activating lysine-acyltransferase